jgi:type VI secretion system protein ImpA
LAGFWSTAEHMPLTDLLPIDALRESPASGGPAGIDLRADEEGRRDWMEIRQLRDEARRIERESDADHQVDRSAALQPWRTITTRCTEVLCNKSRDLAVAAMLIESLARTEGFGGIADGCDVARLMVELQWADLFPLPDPDDGPTDAVTIAMERALPLIRLVGDDAEGLLTPAILHIPLVDGRNGERFGLGHWRLSQTLRGETEQDKKDAAAQRGCPLPETFEAAVAGTSPEFLRTTCRDIGRARQAWDALASAVATASEDVAVVPTIPLRDLFTECEAAMLPASPSLAQSKTVAADLHQQEAPPSDLPNQLGGLVRGGINRDTVLKQLDEAADFFERHDPHSLLAAQLRNIVRMAKLTREDYYRELVGNAGGLESLTRMTGIRFSSSE